MADERKIRPERFVDSGVEVALFMSLEDENGNPVEMEQPSAEEIDRFLDELSPPVKTREKTARE
jgi:hypothetical protein